MAVTEQTDPPAIPEAAATGSGPGRRRRRRRKPVRGFLKVTHRWTALVLGVLLVVITTSGAILLYKPEVFQWTHPDLFTSTPTSTPITMADAFTIADAHDPDLHAHDGYLAHGVYAIHGTDWSGPAVYIDAGTGAVNGVDSDAGGVMGFLDNLHECGLSCEDYPGYVAALNATPLGFLAGTSFYTGDDGQPVPLWQSLSEMTVGAFLLGMLGLLLLFLAVSGIPLWWPSFRRFWQGFRIRWRGGRFARDYDVHQVVGLISVPFLLMWAITGAGFEFPFVETTWYAATGSEAFDWEAHEFTSVESTAPDITLAQAEAAAIALVGGATRVDLATLPDPDEPTSAYSFYLTEGYDPYGYSDYPGNVGVGVDRHDAGRAEITAGPEVQTVSQYVWTLWNFPTHAGNVVNGWWRLIWFVFGLVPLLLMVTGISTWLVRRRTRRERTAARA